MIWKYKRTLAIILLLLIAAAGVAYWGQGLSSRDPVDITVIIKSTDASIEFWEVLIDGVQEAAQEFEANVKVTGSKTETDVDEQIALVEQAIGEKPDAIVLAANDFDRLVPIAEKVRSKGIKLIIVDSDKVTLVGFDSSVNEIMLLDEGVMKATVIQRPFQMGYLSMKTAIDAVRNKSVPKSIDTGSLVITKQNMYEEENQKLLFPFVTN
ncbi:substrate-binding domain-containing protein [Paenibacillus sp. MCAF20]